MGGRSLLWYISRLKSNVACRLRLLRPGGGPCSRPWLRLLCGLVDAITVSLSRTRKEGRWTSFGGRSWLRIVMSGADFRFTLSNALLGRSHSIHHRLNIASPALGVAVNCTCSLGDLSVERRKSVGGPTTKGVRQELQADGMDGSEGRVQSLAAQKPSNRRTAPCLVCKYPGWQYAGGEVRVRWARRYMENGELSMARPQWVGGDACTWIKLPARRRAVPGGFGAGESADGGGPSSGHSASRVHCSSLGRPAKWR
jgi:hypothetical protein